MRAWSLPSKPCSIARASTSSIRSIAESNTMPMGGLAGPGNCMSSKIQRVQASRGIAEMLDVHTHAVHHRQIEVAHRGFLAVHDAPPRFEVAAAAPGDQGGQVLVQMAVAVGKPRAIHDHAIVEQRPIA